MSSVSIEAATHTSSKFLDFFDEYFMLCSYKFFVYEIKFQAIEEAGRQGRHHYKKLAERNTLDRPQAKINYRLRTM